MALARLMAGCHRSGQGRLVVAHFNHRLRGDASEQDAEFVKQLAGQLGLDFELGGDTANLVSGPDEESLRNQRYAFLTATAERVGARYLAVAHTADDQVETILHRIVRATGLKGLAGMPRYRALTEAVTLVRPLLDFSRDSLRDYLRSNGQEHREDATNEDTRYTRNRIRHQLLPYLREHFNQEIDGALLRLGQLAQESQAQVARQVDSLIDQAVKITTHEVIIDTSRLDFGEPYVVREMLMEIWRRQIWPLGEMGFQQWESIAVMATSPQQSPPITMPGGIRITGGPRELHMKRSDEPSH